MTHTMFLSKTCVDWIETGSKLYGSRDKFNVLFLMVHFGNLELAIEADGGDGELPPLHVGFIDVNDKIVVRQVP